MQENYMNNKHQYLVEFNADMIGKATSKETGRKIRLSLTEDCRMDSRYNGKNDKRLRF